MTSPRTPRQLSGWTVPDHVDFQVSTGGVHLNCIYPGCGATTRVWQIGAAGWDVSPWVSDHAHGKTIGPLSEVLPETPEPPRLTHDEARAAAISQMKAAEQRREDVAVAEVERGAEHCYFEGCPEWITGSSDYCPEHAKLYAPVPASQSVPAVPAAEIIDEFVRVGWRPPLPEVMYDAGETAEEAVRRLAAEVVGLRQRLSSSLPDSETEWGWKPDPDEPDEVICATDEQAARERVSRASYRKLACREVGPWIEVTS